RVSSRALHIRQSMHPRLRGSPRRSFAKESDHVVERSTKRGKFRVRLARRAILTRRNARPVRIERARGNHCRTRMSIGTAGSFFLLLACYPDTDSSRGRIPEHFAARPVQPDPATAGPYASATPVPTREEAG